MCSLASLLFLHGFGLLPLFSPRPQKKRKEGQKSSRLLKLFRKIGPKLKKGKKGEEKGTDRLAPLERDAGGGGGGKEELIEKAEQTWTREEHSDGTLAALAARVEWTLGPVEEEARQTRGRRSSSQQSLQLDLHGQIGEQEEGNSRAHSEEQQKVGQSESKKRKKSFKICKRVSGAEPFEEIRLPTSVEDKVRPKIMSTNSGNRFKIIPVENSYRRGRWHILEYYEGADIKKKCPEEEEGGKALQAQAQKCQWATRKENTILPPSAASGLLRSSPPSQEKDQLLLFSRTSLSPPGLTPASPGSHPRRNSFQLITIRNLEEHRFSSSVPTSISEEKLNLLGKEEVLPDPSTSPQIVELQIPEPAQGRGGAAMALVVDGPIALPGPSPPACPSPANPSQIRMIQQFGLEHTLSLGLEQSAGLMSSSPRQQPSAQQQYFSASFGPGQMQFCQQQKVLEERRAAALMRRSSSASTGVVPSPNVQPRKAADVSLAIDSKIEQAMDLVKAHLIYAVRDEIEVLRARIVELEGTVMRLEAENSVLRESIPAQALAGLCLELSKAARPPFPFAPAAAIAQ